MDELKRYERQYILDSIGIDGQRRLSASTVVIVGCGALGTAIANSVVRAGVGRVRIVDRDFVELNNLQRQILFDETDVEAGIPKAIAAGQKLRSINSQVFVEPCVTDLSPSNAESLITDADLVLDGTDNFETRFLINDVCVKHDTPWIYGGVIDTRGMSMPIIPHKSPCFRCFLSEIPPPGSIPTCDTVGVLATTVAVVAALEVTEGLKILTGQDQELNQHMAYVDVWRGDFEQIDIQKQEGECSTCGLERFEFLNTEKGSLITSLCGREAVQVDMQGEAKVSLPRLAERLSPIGEVSFNEYILRFRFDTYELAIFPDGRAIIKGCTDPQKARMLYAKYIGM